MFKKFSKGILIIVLLALLFIGYSLFSFLLDNKTTNNKPGAKDGYTIFTGGGIMVGVEELPPCGGKYYAINNKEKFVVCLKELE